MCVIYSPKQLLRPADLFADEAQLSLVYSLNIGGYGKFRCLSALLPRCTKRDKKPLSTDRAVETSDGASKIQTQTICAIAIYLVA
jgi:hypothetical protein